MTSGCIEPVNLTFAPVSSNLATSSFVVLRRKPIIPWYVSLGQPDIQNIFNLLIWGIKRRREEELQFFHPKRESVSRGRVLIASITQYVDISCVCARERFLRFLHVAHIILITSSEGTAKSSKGWNVKDLNLDPLFCTANKRLDIVTRAPLPMYRSSILRDFNKNGINILSWMEYDANNDLILVHRFKTWSSLIGVSITESSTMLLKDSIWSIWKH